ncbi:hypothetical protein I6H58_08460 [Rothia kristinae]|uniref:Uncharacterized protein n=1 Tax=Rothia kristinae TaxID=37923 RepID=A0A7T4T429_9MICC|nr:hypothetical protein [Rothia kristinae]QQC58984.1 hypothetical protein I6H58_08460 [Rothia kristinae]
MSSIIVPHQSRTVFTRSSRSIRRSRWLVRDSDQPVIFDDLDPTATPSIVAHRQQDGRLRQGDARTACAGLGEARLEQRVRPQPQRPGLLLRGCELIRWGPPGEIVPDIQRILVVEEVVLIKQILHLGSLEVVILDAVIRADARLDAGVRSGAGLGVGVASVVHARSLAHHLPHAQTATAPCG